MEKHKLAQNILLGYTLQNSSQIDQSFIEKLSIPKSYLKILPFFRQNKKQAVKYKDHIANIFNWAKDQEWIDEDDSDKRTVCHEWLKNCLEDYICRVCPLVQNATMF